MDLEFHRNHAKWFASPVLRAIDRYALIRPGDRVCVGLSGGKDSVALLFILSYLRRYSHLEFDLSALHVRTSAAYDTAALITYCRRLEVPYAEVPLVLPARAATGKVCSVCARLKRGAAARALAEHGIRTLAYGHHADDVAVTLLMNLVQHKKIGSFSPKVSVEGAPLTLIRPMIYLEERTVAAVHRSAGLPLLDATCPYAQSNLRQRYRESLGLLARSIGVRGLARRVVGALERLDGTSRWRAIEKVSVTALDGEDERITLSGEVKRSVDGRVRHGLECRGPQVRGGGSGPDQMRIASID